MKEAKSFLTGVGVLTVILVIALLVIDYTGVYGLHKHTWWILLYNVLLAVGSFFMIKKGSKGDNYDFYNYFMGNTAVRLLLSATLFLIYFLNVKENRIQFIITFFSFYFIYTVFEIKSLLANLRSNSERVDNKDEKQIES